MLLLRTDGGIRTHTDGGLNAVPLPVLGYVSVVDRAALEPSPAGVRPAATPSQLQERWVSPRDRTRRISGTG
jgi:hypothetical protein